MAKNSDVSKNYILLFSLNFLCFGNILLQKNLQYNIQTEFSYSNDVKLYKQIQHSVKSQSTFFSVISTRYKTVKYNC